MGPGETGASTAHSPARCHRLDDRAGKELFHGSARCNACHGDNARGTDRGPSLTGAVWLRGDGSYDSIVKQVLHGVPASASMSGEAMPIRGWEPMNDEEVQAVAAYVWSITHPPRAPE